MDSAIDSDELARNVLTQANFRVRVGLLMAAVIVAIYTFGPYHTPADPFVAGGIVTLYVVYTLVARHFSKNPEPLTYRDLVMITAVMDPLFLSVWLFIAGESSVLACGLYLFTVLGFGFRVGAVPMHVCQTMSLTGFTVVVLMSDTWQGHVLFALSHMILLLLVPVYASFLIARIRKAKALAEHESRAKSQLLAKVSHELRTPLTGISAAAQLMEVESGDPDTLRRARSILHLSASLDSEIKQLLDLSRIESKGSLQSTTDSAPFSVAVAAASAFKALESIAAGKNIDVKLEFDEAIRLPVVGHCGDLIAVLTNLCGNAVKFTDSGSVRLKVRLVDHRDGVYELWFGVSDTGIGIAPEFHEKIFDPFFQVASDSQHKRGGSGLGMSIAKEIVGRMGGQLKVDSTLGEGSCFHFVLKLPVESESLLPRLESETKQPVVLVTPKRVLIADDNLTNLDLLEEMLGKDGHEVVAVSCGRDAAVQLGTGEFDIVFLDYNMADVDGATVYQNYALSRVKVAPTFFVTADATGLTAETLQELGATGIIHKPVTFHKIRSAMSQAFPDEPGAGTVPEAGPPQAGRRSVELSAVPVEYVGADLLDNLREIRDTPEFHIRILSESILELESLHQDLAAAIARKDLPAVHRVAHSLKGVALSSSAGRLAAVADRLMTIRANVLLAEEGKWQQDLMETAARTVEALKEVRRSIAAPKAVNT
ncbi:sensor histidine kinase [Marilutibacter chinensis]|uniref:histidine kinase n=1 Tax=Marilutibacter chinensis TaxID=2912247 RepID=A0ABS9HW47_9GAMM|nr:sensor histidine kinase [Lysobacter chinensis]MCF7222409.1 ATP-binding protein [Lysobacter chinensis]